MYSPFTFQIEFINPSDKTPNRISKQSGIVYAENYSNAVARLTDYFGEDETVSLNNIVELEDDPIILPKKVVRNIIEEEYFDEYDD